ncbi:restriction endonuclease [Allokutzneria sp. NRRL B-24872]|uniref:nSTAND3 domain-containing NTPase n=1 Tax=Allokutzneria sp. NRRL B-24872 TaxID=1137961 RepID=UPI000A39BF23|nr:restriction endonuclease [Allokutzneria sp. NRRL B-24872]
MPEYDFLSLSPHDFELLMRDLLSAEYATNFEAFAYGPDGGVDLRGQVDNKKFVVQCKHYARSKFSDLKRAVSNEVAKMRKERPDRYLLATTQDLTRGQKDILLAELGALVESSSEVLSRSDINYLLSVHSSVERNHFKLWLASSVVLQRIVNSGVWERSEALMETVQSRVRLYVSNVSHDRAVQMLANSHVVAITGAPGVGKSMLADMLLLSHWEEGWQVVVIDSNIAEGWSAWAADRKQIFLYDDFLGQTDFSERSVKNEPASLTKFMDRVVSHADKRMVLTTRSHVLRQAQSRNEPLARSNLEFWQCVVEMTDFNLLQRAHVLYNHLYFSDKPRWVVQEVARDLDSIWSLVRHSNFTPRIVELIIRRPHRSGKSLVQAIGAAFERPVELWGSKFRKFFVFDSAEHFASSCYLPCKGGVGG